MLRRRQELDRLVWLLFLFYHIFFLDFETVFCDASAMEKVSDSWLSKSQLS